MAREPRVVIVGAGFAGLNLVRSLAGKPFRLTVIDRNNYHTFQPLLYQVATGFLEANSIANNVRAIFQDQENVSFVMGEVAAVDIDRRDVRVVTPAGGRLDLEYDYLVLATGVVTDFFGIDGASHAFTLKSLDDAIRLRNQILRQFELAATPGEAGDEGSLTFAIVGGGATGVELAGAMCDLLRHTFRRQFADRVVSGANIVLVEALPHLLDAFTPQSGAYARRLLEQRGVQVLLGDAVASVDERGLSLRSGRRVPARTVIWVAGVKAGPLISALPSGHARAGRVVVAPDLSLRRHPEVFVLGDASAVWDNRGSLLPPLAPVALQEGWHTGRQLERRLSGRPSRAFDYKDRGAMSTVGRNAAIAELPGGLAVYGFPAWTLWLGLHLVELIGFRNRANVLLDWGWNYLTHHQGSGLMECQGLPRPV